MPLWYHQAVPRRDRIGIADQHGQIVSFDDPGERQGAEGACHQGKNKGLISLGFEGTTLVENMRPWLLTAEVREPTIKFALRVWADAHTNLLFRARWFAFEGNVTYNGNQAESVSPLIRRGLFYF